MPREPRPTGITITETRGTNRKKFTSRERSIILLSAQGETVDSSAQKLGISPNTVKTHNKHIFNNLGIRTMAGVVMFALRDGRIQPAEVLAGYDLTRLNRLSAGEQRVLAALTEKGRPDTSNRQIAADLSLTEDTIRKSLQRIAAKIGSSGKEQTAAIALAVKLIDEDQSCLTSLAAVIDQTDLSAILAAGSNMETFTRLRKRFNTSGIFETLFAGIKNNTIDGDTFTQGFERDSIFTLRPVELNLLQRFISDDGKNSSYAAIAQEAHLAPADIAARFADIKNKLDIDIHPGVLYYALLHQPVRRRRP